MLNWEINRGNERHIVWICLTTTDVLGIRWWSWSRILFTCSYLVTGGWCSEHMRAGAGICIITVPRVVVSQWCCCWWPWLYVFRVGPASPGTTITSGMHHSVIIQDLSFMDLRYANIEWILVKHQS